MKSVCVLLFAVALVVAAKTATDDDTTKGPNEMSDLLQRITKVTDRVKEMRQIASGNYTEPLPESPEDSKKNVTYDDLIKRVESASQKVRELQARLSTILKKTSEKRPSPGDQQPEK